MWVVTRRTGSVRDAGQFGGGFAAVLVGLAEQPLTVNGVQGPSPQTAKWQAEAGEFLVLPFGHPQDDLGGGVVARVFEAFLHTAQRPRPGLGEVVLAEVDQGGVVEVDGGLVRHEVAHQRVAVQQPVDLTERLGFQQSRGELAVRGVLMSRSATSTVTSSRPTTRSMPKVESSPSWTMTWPKAIGQHAAAQFRRATGTRGRPCSEGYARTGRACRRRATALGLLHRNLIEDQPPCRGVEALIVPASYKLSAELAILLGARRSPALISRSSDNQMEADSALEGIRKCDTAIAVGLAPQK
jgi:hypothetical protein